MIGDIDKSHLEKYEQGPLYKKVKSIILEKITSGEWKANYLLPSEAELAGLLKVSSGTIRKALDELTASNLLIRRQGKGTFVSSHNVEWYLFRFFKLCHRNGKKYYPQSKILSVIKRKCCKIEIEALKIKKGESVIEIHRLRSLNNKFCIDEKVVISKRLFPNLDEKIQFPNQLYEFYQNQEGRLIYRIIEKIEAVNSDKRLSQTLNVKINTALLKIHRVAIGPDLEPIELRISHCLTDDYYYLSNLI